MVAAGMAYAGPLMIKQILNYMSMKNATQKDQDDAYNYATIWIVLFFFKIFVNEYSLRMCFVMGIKAQ